MANMICANCWGSRINPAEDRECSYCNPCPTCKGVGTVSDVQLSEHFLLSEMLASQTAVRLGISNNSDNFAISSLKYVCGSLLEPIRANFGALHVDSGFRSVAVNKAVGGVATSAHCYGLAADINVIDKNITRKQVVDWVIQHVPSYDQVIFEGTWVHIAHSHMKDNRKQALMMFKGKYEIYRPDDLRVNS